MNKTILKAKAYLKNEFKRHSFFLEKKLLFFIMLLLLRSFVYIAFLLEWSSAKCEGLTDSFNMGSSYTQLSQQPEELEQPEGRGYKQETTSKEEENLSKHLLDIMYLGTVFTIGLSVGALIVLLLRGE